MKRGEVWTVSGTGYAGKPRPAIIVQDDRFDATNSVTLCVFTTDETDAPFFRIPIPPSAQNGLLTTSRLMVDKLTTVSKKKLGDRLGKLNEDHMVQMNRAILVFLGLA